MAADGGEKATVECLFPPARVFSTICNRLINLTHALIGCALAYCVMRQALVLHHKRFTKFDAYFHFSENKGNIYERMVLVEGYNYGLEITNINQTITRVVKF